MPMTGERIITAIYMPHAVLDIFGFEFFFSFINKRGLSFTCTASSTHTQTIIDGGKFPFVLHTILNLRKEDYIRFSCSPSYSSRFEKHFSSRNKIILK